MARSKLHSRIITLAGWGCFALIAGIMCEIGARLDDWFFDGIPFTANPTYQSLFLLDDTGMRVGRPGAQWKKVHLNNVGLRGPDVQIDRGNHCQRWMFIGASETFGEPTQANKDYPAQVRESLRRKGCYEVLNTAFPGFDVRALMRYYEYYMSQLKPDVVFVYPPTHFYLGEVGPRNTTPPQRAPTYPNSSPGILERSRFLERLRDTAEMPAFIQKKRVRQWIEDAQRGKSADWAFRTIPQDRLDLFTNDLRDFIALIRASGAEPVLLTHAVRVASPPREEDLNDLYAMRVYVPRATEATLAGFEYAAAERTREVAAATNVPLVDVAQQLSGRRELFIDLVHFTNEGHAKVAQLILQQMQSR